MDTIGFLASGTVQLYDAGAHAHYQSLVLVVNMATALEECVTEE
jgi:hypothetical protein